MFNLSTSARLLDCNIENIRALNKLEIIVPTPYGYTFEQLVVMKVIVLIRNELKYGNFKFGETFKENQTVINELPLLIYLDGGYLLFPDIKDPVIDEWLLPLDKEVFLTKVDKKNNEFIKKYWQTTIIVADSKSMIMIPLNRVKKHIEQKAEALDLSVNLVNSKKLRFDEKGILTGVSS